MSASLGRASWQTAPMTRPALSFLALGAIGAMALALNSPGPELCAVNVFRDYELGWAYYAQVRLAPGCPDGGSARVRKTSTLSTKEKGNTYQPIRPETGAWVVTHNGDDIPSSSQFTLNNWAWQYWTGKTWAAAVVR
jgi:hypothetical protein